MTSECGIHQVNLYTVNDLQGAHHATNLEWPVGEDGEDDKDVANNGHRDADSSEEDE